MSEPIYLDNQATTPLDPRVLEKMLPYFCEVFGNPASIDHLHGHKAKEVVTDARQIICDCLGGRKSSEILFTSGATESNNLALIGAFRKQRSKGNHIISTEIEHPAVLDTLDYLKDEGAEVTLIPVDRFGTVDPQAIADAIKEETVLISVMFANNEIGTIQPIKEIGDFAKQRGILFHTDAAQAVGSEAINVYDMNIDMLSFSAHKFYGPKGVGGLFIRSFSPAVRLAPISFGGGQERAMRSGTLNVPGIVGMAKALEIATDELEKENSRLNQLTKEVVNALVTKFPDIRVNGSPEKKLAKNVNITIPGIESKALLHHLKNQISCSAGSACSTTKVKPSHVLQAIGLSEDQIHQTIRLGFSRFIDDSKIISEILIVGIDHIRSISA